MSDVDCNRPDRSAAERGSPEFAEDRTQVNSLNNKWLFDETASSQFTAAKHNQANFDNMQARLTQSFDETLNLQKKVNQDYFDQKAKLEIELESLRTQRSRHADDNAYVTRYDLSNPVTTGAGDTLRSAAYTPNRAVDTASAGVGVSAEAVAAAVAKQVDATITPVLATLQQIVQALATATTSIANVVNQAQPKPA